MSHFRIAFIGVLTSLVLAGVGYAMWVRGLQGGLGHGGHDDPTARSSKLGAPALQTRSPPDAVPALPNLVVLFQDGLLTVRTRGAPLRDVLAAITQSAAVTFASGGEVGENISIDAGPRPVRDVVSELLERASYGYAFVESPGGAGWAAATQVFLVKRGSASESSGRTFVQQASAVPIWPVQSRFDQHLPLPDEGALKQQRAVDALFDACKAQACDTS